MHSYVGQGTEGRGGEGGRAATRGGRDGESLLEQENEAVLVTDVTAGLPCTITFSACLTMLNLGL